MSIASNNDINSSNMREITSEAVNTFLNGHDPMEHIITIECAYDEDKVSIVYINGKGQKRIKLDDFKPFVWAKNSAAIRLFGGDRKKIMSRLRQYGISVKKLITTEEGKAEVSDRLENGYKYMFYATRRMSNKTFQQFFQEAGVPINERTKKDQPNESNREFLAVTPVEQYMIQTGKRLFKGYNNYDDLTRLTFDLETQGLNPKIHRIEQIGIHTNKGYDKIIEIEGKTKAELDAAEMAGIEQAIFILSQIQPDVIAGHNSENFDWDFFMVRYEELGGDFQEMTLRFFKHPIYKKAKESVLKLGQEVEYYRPTVMWGHIILDSLHAARRAQALDSSMKSSNLKYVTKYLKLKKPNRVYVPGDKITSTWNVQEKVYGFSDTDGDWYRITDKRPLMDGYELVSGRYIVERYLLDDLWETDKVEEKLNESNFLVGKMLPTTFTRACTMGTAGIWKLIMLAWCYENGLAVPAAAPSKRFTGGLSRLLKTGFVDRIVKLDYNSLYPSIILTWHVSTPIDIMNVMLSFLEYILTQREKYKDLKGVAGDRAKILKKELAAYDGLDELFKRNLKTEIQKWEIEKTGNDKKQLPLKILANSFFGSYGAPNIFPFGDVDAAEKTTCIGRMSLRLMIYHFSKIGYEPIVGDSFTADTPLFIKYDISGKIDIKPISELIGETEIDALGREYDTSKKPYKVLCRSGWVRPEYIYRHKTNKPLYTVSDGNMSVTVTEDHSLFDDNKNKIKPSEISTNTKLEYYTDKFWYGEGSHKVNNSVITTTARMLKRGTLDRVPMFLFNDVSSEHIKIFLNELKGWDYSNASKTCQAGIQFLERKNKYETSKI